MTSYPPGRRGDKAIAYELNEWLHDAEKHAKQNQCDLAIQDAIVATMYLGRAIERGMINDENQIRRTYRISDVLNKCHRKMPRHRR